MNGGSPLEDQAVSQSRPIYTFLEGEFHQQSAELALEYPLTLIVNDAEFATIVCTPTHLNELIVGFIASEGLISSYAEIESLVVNQDQGIAYVDLHKRSSLDPSMFTKRRITSCCGKSRQSLYFQSDANIVRKVEASFQVTTHQIIANMRLLSARSDIHCLTGGVHNAALCSTNDMICLYSDIGRHNALDRIFGACLIDHIDTHDTALVFSGRISSEMVIKAAKIGSPILLSKSAPTELALQLAEELGITTVGFIRGEAFNVYTYPERIHGFIDMRRE
jgi:FdhD protein